MWGVGVPVAMHFKLTDGPGCNVWAMNLYTRRGDAALGCKN